MRINSQSPTIWDNIEWITRIAIPESLWGNSWWNQITIINIIPELYGGASLADCWWRYYHNFRNLTNPLNYRIMKRASRGWWLREGNPWSIYNRKRDNFPGSLMCRWINGRGKSGLRWVNRGWSGRINGPPWINNWVVNSNNEIESMKGRRWSIQLREHV